MLFHMGTASRELGPLVEAVAAELRARRAYLNLGIRELADKARLPHPTVSKSLNGKRVIDVEELGRLAYALNIGPDVIMRDALANLKKRGFEISSYIPSLNNADAADLRRFGIKPRLSVVPPTDTEDLHNVDISGEKMAASKDTKPVPPERGES